MILMLVGPALMIFMCFFHPGNEKVTLTGILSLINLNNMFFVQGAYFISYYNQIQAGLGAFWRKSIAVPFFVFFVPNCFY